MSHPGLAHSAVGAADADIFVAAAKTALGMPLEVGEDHQTVVVLDMAAHAHPGEPFAPSHGQRDGVFLVEDVDRCESPSVYFQRLAVLRGGVAVALVVGVGLNDVGTFEVFGHQCFHPFARDDVGAVFLAGVQFQGHLACDVAVHLLVCHDKAVRREVAGEIDHGGVAGALAHGHIFVATSAGSGFLIGAGGSCLQVLTATSDENCT